MDPTYRRLLITIGSIIVILLIVLIFLVLSDDKATPEAADSTVAGVTTIGGGGSVSSSLGPTSTTAATTASAPTTAPLVTTATTAEPPGPPSGDCSGLPSATIPGAEPGVTSADGDFDGDGNLDQLIGYRDAGGTWWVQIAFSYGYATETAVFGPVTALGAQDFGGTGRDVGFAYVDGGASTQLVGFFFVPGCDVFEATIAGSGATARFPIGGGVLHLDGMSCNFDGFTATAATSGDGVAWEYTTTDYVWVPGLLEFESRASSVQLLMSPADDATIFGAVDFECPALAP